MQQPSDSEQVLGIVVDITKGKHFKDLLKDAALLSVEFRPQRSGHLLFLPLNVSGESDQKFNTFLHRHPELRIERRSMQSLVRIAHTLGLSDRLKRLLPDYDGAGYELYEDLLILPPLRANKMTDGKQQEPSADALHQLAAAFGVRVIAAMQPIQRGRQRSPSLRFVHVHPATKLESFWTSVRQNGIVYTWMPLHTMFCAGNISEKLRVASFDCSGETVLDLYAGIGYFTLPYLVHASAAVVIAVDMNERSVEGLRRGLAQNGVASERCVVLCGDNAAFVHVYESKCDRVNLGLLPSSQQGWPLAVRALKPSGGRLHVHENVGEGRETEFASLLVATLGALWTEHKLSASSITVEHVQRVKSYAPKVNHLVFDVCIAACK